MRKFTLLLATCAVSLCGMAQTAFFSKTANKAGAELRMNTERFQVTANTNKVLSRQNVVARKVNAANFKSVAKAPTNGEVPAYISFGLIYSPLMGSFSNVYMEPVTISVSDNTVALDFYSTGDFGAFTGTIVGKPSDPQFSNADSITFENGQILAASADRSMYIKAYTCDIMQDETGAIIPVPLREQPTFGGYYYSNTNETYIPGVIAYFIEGADGTLGDVYLAYAFADIIPSSFFNDFTYKATVTATSDFEDEDDDGNGLGTYHKYENTSAEAIMAEEGIYLRGASFSYPYTCLPFIYPYDPATYEVIDESTVTLARNSFIADFYLSQYEYVDFGLMAGGLSGYNIVDYPMNVKTDIYFNKTLTAADADIVFAELMWVPVQEGISEEKQGVYINDMSSDYTISISNELVSDGIAGVKDSNSSVLSKEYYDLSGRKVESTAKGLVIEKVRYADGKTMSRKVVRK